VATTTTPGSPRSTPTASSSSSHLKDNTDYGVLERRPVPQRGCVQRDEIIFLYKVAREGERDLFLSRIEVWDETQQRTLVFLTNHRRFAASTIADIYRQRWQIELFFKALKQNLRIKTFVGTSPNALQVQVWTAVAPILGSRCWVLRDHGESRRR
jgi:IS4 transposase